MSVSHCLRVGGKINFFLRITGVRDDGYHELETLFLPLPQPCDELEARERPGGGLRLDCADPAVDPANNTLTRAYAAYARETGFAPGLDLLLRKGIPAGAGLGGGSADAAALLLWLQTRNPHPLPEEDLARTALRVGADVPFFLDPRPSLGAGLGEDLRVVDNPLAGFFLLLLCPAFAVRSADAYAAWDRERELGNLTLWPKADKNGGSCSQTLRQADNCFEPVVFAAHPELARLKARLFQEGAAAAGMSGSGSSLFALFRTRERAEQAACRFAPDASDVPDRDEAGAELFVYGPMLPGTRPA